MLAWLVGWLDGWLFDWNRWEMGLGGSTRAWGWIALGLRLVGAWIDDSLLSIHAVAVAAASAAAVYLPLVFPVSFSLSLSSHLSFWLPGPVYPFDWHYFIINFRWQHLTHMQHRSNVRASLESLTTSKNTITYRKRDNDVSSATEIKFAPLTLSFSVSLSLCLSLLVTRSVVAASRLLMPFNCCKWPRA